MVSGTAGYAPASSRSNAHTVSAVTYVRCWTVTHLFGGGMEGCEDSQALTTTWRCDHHPRETPPAGEKRGIHPMCRLQKEARPLPRVGFRQAGLECVGFEHFLLRRSSFGGNLTELAGLHAELL